MPPERLANVARALRHRNFQLFFAGQLISLVGTWMQTVAQSWLVYRLTGSALLLGTVGFASQFPVFLMSPVGGIVADRKNRHRVVIATQAASMVLALILAWLTLTNRVQVFHVMLLAGLLGVVNAFDLPARQAFIMDMVGREDLINAIALNSSMFNGARIVGPAVAGILVASIGEGWCFFANAVSYIAVIVGLLLMRVSHTPKKEHRPALEDLREGFSFVRHTKPILALLLLLGLVSLVGMPYTVLMPIFADQILHVGARGLGILMGATGLGALIAALSLAMRSGVKGLGTWVSRASIAFGFTLIAFAFSRWYLVSAAILVLLGFSMMMQMTASNTLIQSMVPDRLRGRVMSVYAMMFMGMAPIGAFSAGAVAHRLGAPLTLAIGGAACIVGAALFTVELPTFRIEARKLILAQEMGTGTPAEGVGLQTVISDADVAVEEAAFVASPLAASISDSGAQEGKD
ncbi:MAG: major facilitator superfamily transporter [Acidobacteriaceae bacterium]|nr:major facilitator superfamily transporter [Acidobacteriaceae bacterium]